MWPFSKKAKTSDVTLPDGLQLQIITLPEEQYRKKYQELSNRKVETDMEKLEQEFKKFRELLIGELGKVGQESPFMEGDYAVSGEFQETFFLCGAIYTNKMVCSRYLSAILNAVQQLARPDQWMYHTVCEVWMNEDEPRIGDAEFFIIDHKMYVSMDEQNYEELFAR